MDIHVHIEKKHFVILMVAISFLGLFMLGNAADVDVNDAWHPLQQIAKSSSDETSVDQDGDGVIDQANNSDMVDGKHANQLEDGYIGDSESGGHDAGSDLNMGYYDLCLNGDCRDSWPEDTSAETECYSNEYLDGDGNCVDENNLEDGYIGDYEYGGHDAGSDLNMGYHDLCLNGDCRGSWPSGGDGYLPDDPATSDVDMNDNDIINVNDIEHASKVDVDMLVDVILINGINKENAVKFDNSIRMRDRSGHSNTNRIVGVNNLKVHRITEEQNIGSQDGYVEIGDSLWVEGDFNVKGAKNFIHPVEGTNKEVVYTSSESGEAVVEWTDSVEVSRDGTFIEFPQHLKYVLSKEEDYHVIVTSIDSLADVGVFEKKNDGFTLKSEKNTKVDFHLRGVRKSYEDKQIIRKKQ